MSSRYGDFVLYRPRVTPLTYALWGGPFVLARRRIARVLADFARAPRSTSRRGRTDVTRCTSSRRCCAPSPSASCSGRCSGRGAPRAVGRFSASPCRLRSCRSRSACMSTCRLGIPKGSSARATGREGQRLVGELAARLEQTPEDVDGLGVALPQLHRARRLRQGRPRMQQAWNRTPQPDNDLKVAYAEAADLERSRLRWPATRASSSRKCSRAEPANPKALWYGGLVALEHGREDDVRARWTRLLALNPPDRSRRCCARSSRRSAQLRKPAARRAAAPGGPQRRAPPRAPRSSST